MRYWMCGEDEGYERELERVRRVGGLLPAPLPPAAVTGTTVLVIGEIALFAAFAAVLALCFR